MASFDKSRVEAQLIDFDTAFYFQYYPDLLHLKEAKALKMHYLEYGIKEGRKKNLAEATRDFESRFGPVPKDFSPQLYSLFNEDLARTFSHDWQIAFHYLEFGRKEGRRYKALDHHNEHHKGGQPFLPWVGLFRYADFVASAQGWLDQTPQTKEQAVRIFIEVGIERLAPLNLDHTFDPGFYRSAYDFDDFITDAALYRHWLNIGIPRGFFPSEEKALQDYVSSHQYPPSFDWIGYKSALPKREAQGLRNRVEVLHHLFEHGFEGGLTNHIFGHHAGELFGSIGDYHLIRGHYPLAIAAYDRASAGNKAALGVVHLRGDAHAALGNNAAAHADFVRAAAGPCASVWSHIHAARTAVADGSFEKSFDLLAKAHPKWVKKAEFRATVNDIIEQFFASKTQAAMALYEAGDRHIADAYMFEALDAVRARITQLEELPPALPVASKGHVAILADHNLAQCKHYRVEQKLCQLKHAGIAAQAFRHNDLAPFIRSLLGARAAIFYRVPAFPSIIRGILTANALGIPTYYEVDDLIFDASHYPDTFESYEGQISKAEYNGLLYSVPLFRYAMGLCKHGIASTTPLALQIEPVVQNHDCLVLRNGLDERNSVAIDMGRAQHPVRDTVSIFYGSGTKAHNSDFNELAGPALLSVLERYDNVRLVIVGHLRRRPEFERFSSQITQLDFVPNLEQYWSLLAASDINLAVLRPGLVADCKSEIKWLEAAVLQVPSIVSATATYREILENGVDALLAEDGAAWTKALHRLILDRDLRRDIGAAARRKALRHYSLESVAKQLRTSSGLETAPAGRGIDTSNDAQEREGTKCKMKVLVCNVFFPPQSYGGATRVVSDNVDYFKDQCPDIELSIFATDDGISPPGRLRFDQYRDIPVFRLSTPSECNMDWRPFNPENEEIFERILDTVGPDIVHFHCIQRLTASIVEIAFRRKIPYLVTVHDGWWISDHQFFVDQDDILRLPSADVYETIPRPNISLIESIARRQRLAGLLDGAAQILSVSKQFAEIYRRAGCRNVVAIPNGVSPITPAPRHKSADGRLSLGHVGGRSAHKGATLTEAVFRTMHFDHLKFTMIDMTMEPGTRNERIWGNTPVLLCGSYPQDQVGELYASFDVLLAPSIWPESFGLVTREALAQGLWVVASNRGAVCECIKDGENGFVIDVSDSRALTEVLKKLDADVKRYQTPPPRAHASMRTAADQGAELAELYRKISAVEKVAYPSSDFRG